MNPNDLKQIAELLDKKLQPIQKELEQNGKILTSHTKLLHSLKKDQDIMLTMLDKEQMTQSKRLRRVEEHLDLSPITY